MNIRNQVRLVKAIRDNIPPVGTVGEVIQIVDSENDIYQVFFNGHNISCNLHIASIEMIPKPDEASNYTLMIPRPGGVYHNCELNNATFL